VRIAAGMGSIGIPILGNAKKISNPRVTRGVARNTLT